MYTLKPLFVATLVAGFAIGTAQAAEVKISGILDTGINIQQVKNGENPSGTRVSLDSGQDAGSRVNIRAHEILPSGTKVGIHLGSAIASDTGAYYFGKLFGGNSTLYLQDKTWGEIHMGRSGSLISPYGDTGVIGQLTDNFAWGMGSAGNWRLNSGRYDNQITVATPDFDGLKIYAQRTFSETGSEPQKGGREEHDTHTSVAAVYTNATLDLIAAYDRDQYTNTPTTRYGNEMQVLSLAGNYRVADMQFGLFTQFFKDAYRAPGTASLKDLIADGTTEGRGFDGWLAGLEWMSPVPGGKAYAVAIYNQGKYKGELSANPTQEREFKRYTLGVGYEYVLSRRTCLYAGGIYTHGSGLLASDNFKGSIAEDDINRIQYQFGVLHRW